MTQWYPASPALWQGRDDSIEAPEKPDTIAS